MKYKNIKKIFFFKEEDNYLSLNKVNYNSLSNKVNFFITYGFLCGNCTGLIHVKNT